jgi:hypothetical protein
MVDNGTEAGGIMMWGAIQMVWLESDGAERDDLLAGLKEAGANKIRLTAKGAKVLGR